MSVCAALLSSPVSAMTASIECMWKLISRSSLQVGIGLSGNPKPLEYPYSSTHRRIACASSSWLTTCSENHRSVRSRSLPQLTVKRESRLR
jgi:hypothetical protein